MTLPSDLLLESKLHPPRLARDLVERVRLHARFDAWRAHKLTLLSAPAGSGKTTAVRSWLAARQLSAESTWLSLDAGDNDPARFWHYLFAACGRRDSAVGFVSDHSLLPMYFGVAQPLLQPLSFDVETLLTPFLNQLQRQTQHSLLILEDYQSIVEPAIHQALGFLLSNLPETFHLLIISRTEPPLALERLRANGELNELLAHELRFSRPEMQEFFVQAALPQPSTELLERIEAQLAGWAAGLRLLSLSLQGDKTPEQVLTSFHGGQRRMRDYFVGEVLHAQPLEIQDFLLRTSVLPRLNPELCTAITGCQKSAEVLERLESSHLFLEALDDGLWYRYQALFAEAMRAEAARRLGVQELDGLFQAASDWFAARNELPEAIEIAFNMQKKEHAAQLLEQYSQTLRYVEPQQHHTLRRWLEQIPEALLKQHPMLCLGYAATLVFGQEQQESPPDESTWLQQQGRVEEFLLVAEEGWRASNDLVGLGRVQAFRAFLGLRQGKREQGLAAARQALEWLPESESTWRGMSLIVLGLEALQTGQVREARSLFQEIYRIWKVFDNRQILDGIALILGMICFVQGELQEAAHYYRELCAGERVEHPAAAAGYLGLSCIFYEWNDLDAARHNLQESQRIADRFPDIPHEVFFAPRELVEALLLHAQGETTRAIQRLNALLLVGKANPQPENELYPYFYHEILSWLVRYSLLLGDRATAQHMVYDLTQHQVQPSTSLSQHALTSRADTAISEEGVSLQNHAVTPFLLLEGQKLLVARLLLAQGEVEGSFKLLTALLPVAQLAGRGHTALQIRLLLAQTYAAQKQFAEAEQLLRDALKQGYNGGYLRTFLDEGEPLFLLLHELAPRLHGSPLRQYVQKLFQAFREARREVKITPVVSTLFEPLSRQEQRVLRLLVAGRSNQEIAQELIVSINTVRTQVQSIYRKLQVNNRQAASEVARQLNLL